jgi:hypothetical protein
MSRITATFNKKYFPKLVGIGLNAMGLVAPKSAARVALNIFCTPRRGRVQSYQKKFLKKFKVVTLDYNGTPVATYDNGKSGKKVLLCHGWESNSFRWRKLYRAIKDTDLNIIMMDAPAHGATGGNEFHALLYGELINVVAAHYKPDTILGHSVGGYSTIYYVSKFKPTFVKNLVIMASPDRLVDITNRYFKMIGLADRIGSRYRQLIKDRFGEEITYYNASTFADDISIGGLIIHDMEDDVNLFYEAEAIHSKWKKSKLIATDGLGHSLQNEKVFDTITSFLMNSN